MKSDMWPYWVLNVATLTGGVIAALSGVKVAAALFPSQHEPVWARAHTPELQLNSTKNQIFASSNPTSTSLPSSVPTLPATSQPASEVTPNEELGEFKITFYVLTEEASFQGQEYDTPLYRIDGSLIGQFPKKFVSDIKIQGSARLDSGDILAYSGSCKFGDGTCYRVLSKKSYPWGQGSTGRALKFMQSAAVDPKVVPYGTKFYIPELDGFSWNGKTYNGCFSADDTGGGVKGKQIDVFIGSRRLLGAALKRFPKGSATVYKGGEKCGDKPKEKATPAPN